MKIETKFNIGDEVWTMKENKPHKIEIKKILCCISNDGISVNYCPFITAIDSEIHDGYNEEEIFANRVELVQSLLDYN